MSKSRRQRKSNRWLERQNRDQYVKKSRQAGYRARAVYKLEQIAQKYHLIRPNDIIVDLGAAPGSWSQYLSTMISGPGKIISVDLLPMEPIKNVNFIQGDFTHLDIVNEIYQTLENRQIDLVLSDMAPNITGIGAVDQARSLELQDMILTFSDRALRTGGHLLTKVFEGETASITWKNLTKRFNRVQAVKPEASRSKSKEIFLLARNHVGERR